MWVILSWCWTCCCCCCISSHLKSEAGGRNASSSSHSSLFFSLSLLSSHGLEKNSRRRTYCTTFLVPLFFLSVPLREQVYVRVYLKVYVRLMEFRENEEDKEGRTRRLLIGWHVTGNASSLRPESAFLVVDSKKPMECDQSPILFRLGVQNAILDTTNQIMVSLYY